MSRNWCYLNLSIGVDRAIIDIHLESLKKFTDAWDFHFFEGLTGDRSFQPNVPLPMRIDFHDVTQLSGVLGKKFDEYAQYNSLTWQFNTYNKWLILEWAFEQGYDNIIYADIDTLWTQDPIDYFKKIFRNYPIFCQSEALFTYPPTFCTGLMGYRANNFTRHFIKAAKEYHVSILNTEEGGDDQTAFNHMMLGDATYLRQVHPLSEARFPVGWMSSLLLKDADMRRSIVGDDIKFRPIFFHANHVIGLEDKLRLMRTAKKRLDPMQ